MTGGTTADRPDRITLRGMQFSGIHGVGEAERAFPQVIEVDLEVETDLSRAAASDDVADTIDYGPLVAICREVVEEETQRLLEAIAGAIVNRVLAETRAEAVTVRVRKLAVPIDVEMEHAEIELRRERITAPG
jgi:dihydroneopterin aldolase